MKPIQIAGVALIALSFAGCQPTGSSRDEIVDETYVHRYGVTVKPEEWNSRGRHGKVISMMKNGVTVTRNYMGGELDGNTTYTFPHSDLIEVVHTYTNGTLMRELVHYRTGTPKKEVLYLGADKHKVSEWYENGTAKSIEEFDGELLVQGNYYNEGQQIESRIENGRGTRINRDIYGQLQSTDEIVDGELALVTIFHSNGAPKEMTPYHHGRIEGTKRSFHPGGEPDRIEEWSNDELNGTVTLYENGDKVAEVPYLHGQKNGVEQRYRDGSAIAERITWKNDQMHGQRSYYIGGNTTTEWYYSDRKVNKNTFDRLTRTQAH